MEKLQLLTKSDVLEIVPVSMRTLNRMLKNGDIPSVKVGGRVFVNQKTLAKWIKELEEPDASEEEEQAAA